MGVDSPAFVFVPGVNHTPLFYQSTVDYLISRGYGASAVNYPTVGPPNQTVGTTYYDEIHAIQTIVAEYVESQHRDVILVCHSYGGWPGSKAVLGWDKATRERNNQTNGIIELFFLGAFILPDNASPTSWDTYIYWLTSEVPQTSLQSTTSPAAALTPTSAERRPLRQRANQARPL